MATIFICSDNTYHYIAIDYFLRKYQHHSVIKLMSNGTNFSENDYIILILDEDNFADHIDMYLTKIIFESGINLLIVGNDDLIEMFRVLVGKKINAINISLSANEYLKHIMRFVNSSCPLKNIPKKKLFSMNQIETIRLLSKGYSISQIAGIKRLNIKTISHYKCFFFKKLGVKNNAINLYKFSRLIFES